MITISQIMTRTQKFAHALDQYDETGSFEHSHRAFAWEFLGGDSDEQVTRESLLNYDYWNGRTTPAKLEFAVNVLLRYWLLNILANVLGCPQHPQHVVAPQVSLTQLPKRVQEVSQM